MNFISKMRTTLTKIDTDYDCREEFELAPGLKCTVRIEQQGIECCNLIATKRREGEAR